MASSQESTVQARSPSIGGHCLNELQGLLHCLKWPLEVEDGQLDDHFPLQTGGCPLPFFQGSVLRFTLVKSGVDTTMSSKPRALHAPLPCLVT